jgi:hypothetical protein
VDPEDVSDAYYSILSYIFFIYSTIKNITIMVAANTAPSKAVAALLIQILYSADIVVGSSL